MRYCLIFFIFGCHEATLSAERWLEEMNVEGLKIVMPEIVI